MLTKRPSKEGLFFWMKIPGQAIAQSSFYTHEQHSVCHGLIVLQNTFQSKF